jgi:hypothetical protein
VYWAGSASLIIDFPCLIDLGDSTAGELAWNRAPSSLRVYPDTSLFFASSAVTPLRCHSSQGAAYCFIATRLPVGNSSETRTWKGGAFLCVYVLK